MRSFEVSWAGVSNSVAWKTYASDSIWGLCVGKLTIATRGLIVFFKIVMEYLKILDK